MMKGGGGRRDAYAGPASSACPAWGYVLGGVIDVWVEFDVVWSRSCHLAVFVVGVLVVLVNGLWMGVDVSGWSSVVYFEELVSSAWPAW